jgi:hypothetical protein
MVAAVAGFFQEFSSGGGFQAFSRLYMTAGEYPESRVLDPGLIIPQL